MTMNKQEQWREEFEEWYALQKDIFAINNYVKERYFKLYLAGRKKGDEESVANGLNHSAFDQVCSMAEEIDAKDEEIAQLKAKLELSDNSIHGVLKVSMDRLRLIEQLKEQLKLERECVDFYADKCEWETIKQNHNQNYHILNYKTGIKNDMEEFGIDMIGGKRARSVQAQRKVEE